MNVLKSESSLRCSDVELVIYAATVFCIVVSAIVYFRSRTTRSIYVIGLASASSVLTWIFNNSEECRRIYCALSPPLWCSVLLCTIHLLMCLALFELFKLFQQASGLAFPR